MINFAMDHNRSGKKTIFQKAVLSGFLLFVFCLSCSSTGKDDKTEAKPAGAQTAWNIIVSGKVAKPQQGQIIIQELKQGSVGWQDTITLKPNATFSKRVQLTQPGYYKITFFNRQTVDLILNKSNLKVNVAGDDASGQAEVIGSPEIDLITRASAMLQEANNSPEIAQLNEQFTKAMQANDEVAMGQLQDTYMKEIQKSHDKIASFLKQQPASLGVMYFLESNNMMDRDKYLHVYVDAAEKAKKEWPNSGYTAQFQSLVNKMKVTAIGQPAPEIALPNPDGQVVKLSSMKGKYVLVDFWAKWCGPCRQENPNVVRAFNKYKDKGFTVFGVSLDRNKEDWVKAIQEDKLTWTHVSDLKFWQSEAAKTYNITGIPFSLLLDPNGVIIAKNLRGKALDNKLAEIFAGK